MSGTTPPSMPRVLVTRRLSSAVEARLDREFAPRRKSDDRAWTPDEMLREAEGCDALIVTSRDYKFTADLFTRLPQSVRALGTFSVGLDHIDVAAATARGIAVFNTPDVLTDATADLTMLLLLGAARRGVEGDALVRAGRWTDPRPNDLLGLELRGRRLGIVGMGRIGQAVAQRARAFGMEIHYSSPRRLAPALEAGARFYENVDDLLPVSQFLSLHCPATPTTVGLLNAARLARLPAGAVVVNAARGSLVVDDDLIAALKSGQLFAAGLDVFNKEPDLHPGYRELPNVFLMPHAGSATVETRTAMGMILLDGLNAFFAGRTAPNQVNA